MDMEHIEGLTHIPDRCLDENQEGKRRAADNR